MDKIGLVTVTYNSAKVLQSFLDCVWKQTYNNLVLFVIDNASDDETDSILKISKDNRLNIIKNESNLGVAKANNQGISFAMSMGCDQVLLINNDVEFEINLIEKLLKVQVQQSCSLVVPKMMYFDNNDCLWYAGSWFRKLNGYLPLHRGIGERDEGQFDKITKVDYAPTCCLLVKKQVFLDIGLMDEKYFVYFDDTDFSFRVWRDSRHKLFYCPDVKFYHKVGSLTASFSNSAEKKYRGGFFIKYNIRNHVYFLKKIGTVFCYIFIIWLFFKNNLKFIFNSDIRKNFTTWKLINISYLEGLLLK